MVTAAYRLAIMPTWEMYRVDRFKGSKVQMLNGKSLISDPVNTCWQHKEPPVCRTWQLDTNLDPFCQQKKLAFRLKLD
jgi:hypothetical protein